MSYSFKLKSHPDKKLTKHLANVGRLSREIVDSKSIKNKKVFSDIAYLIGISHDFGKSTEYFQRWVKNREKSKYAYHGFLSSLLGYYVINRYLEKRKLSKEFWHAAPIAWLVIVKHHGDFKNIRGKSGMLSKLSSDEMEDSKKQINKIRRLSEVNRIYNDLTEGFDLKEFTEIILHDSEKFRKKIREDVKKLARQKNLRYYTYILFFYSVLLDADKLDASGIEKLPKRENIERTVVDDYKKRKFKGINREKILNHIREEAYEEVNSSLSIFNVSQNRILSINLPTGAGKTLTGFSFALNLREKVKNEMGFTPKIIYSLPFLSIIDQNSLVLSEVLAEKCGVKWKELFKMNNKEKESLLRKNIHSNLLLKHHHLADITYKEKRDNELHTYMDMNKSLLLTEGWHSEIVISTFVQFFHSLITNRNRAARKFHNMVNSIVVLDEVQSIPHLYWPLVNEMLTFLSEEFNCWIVLMTATRPLIFRGNEIQELARNKEKYFKSLDRIEYSFDLSEKEFAEFNKELLNAIIEEKNKDIMVVLNTISSSKELYNYLKENLCEELGVNPEGCIDEDGICSFPDLELINMSTHILPDFRQRRINRIRNNNKRKVVITTQLVEAGVDISADIVYRDLAPLDSIIQTAGRCNREGMRKGLVNVILLKDKNGGQFSSIYDSTLLDITKEVIENIGEKSSEKNFNLNATKKYYRLILERGTKEKSKYLLKHLRTLSFSDISKFKLIEEDLPSASVFVEINEEAKKARKRLLEILKKPKYVKREKLLKLRKPVNAFTLSVRYDEELRNKLSHLSTISKSKEKREFKPDRDIVVITEEDLEEWYKLDIGFWPPKLVSR